MVPQSLLRPTLAWPWPGLAWPWHGCGITALAWRGVRLHEARRQGPPGHHRQARGLLEVGVQRVWQARATNDVQRVPCRSPCARGALQGRSLVDPSRKRKATPGKDKDKGQDGEAKRGGRKSMAELQQIVDNKSSAAGAAMITAVVVASSAAAASAPMMMTPTVPWRLSADQTMWRTPHTRTRVRARAPQHIATVVAAAVAAEVAVAVAVAVAA